MFIINTFQSRNDFKSNSIFSKDWCNLSAEERLQRKQQWFLEVYNLTVKKFKEENKTTHNNHNVLHVEFVEVPLSIKLNYYQCKNDEDFHLIAKINQPSSNIVDNKLQIKKLIETNRIKLEEITFDFKMVSDFFYSLFSESFGVNKSQVFCSSYIYNKVKNKLETLSSEFSKPMEE